MLCFCCRSGLGVTPRLGLPLSSSGSGRIGPRRSGRRGAGEGMVVPTEEEAGAKEEGEAAP